MAKLGDICTHQSSNIKLDDASSENIMADILFYGAIEP